MAAAVPPGPAPLPPQDPPAVLHDQAGLEPCLIEAALADLLSLRAGWAALLEESSTACHQSGTRGWRRFHEDLSAAWQRVDKAIAAAAVRDGVTAEAPAAAPRSGGARSLAPAEQVSRFRRRARDLEQHTTCALGRTAALGLNHLSHALSRARCELIGLEQPLIALQAAVAPENPR